MISFSQRDPAHVETSNFFQRPGVKHSDNTDQKNKIRTILEDAYALQKLAQSCDIDRFMNKAPTTDDCDLSAISTLAGNITQALDEIVRCAPREQPTKNVETNPKHSRSPIAKTGSPKRCYNCGVTETPRWRRLSPGCPRLCNFCSLVGSKRATRKRSESKGTSISTRFSWPS
ncbi:transcription factor [Fusarium longipes]|uniref:Transcription factor n=1 Tax=Fusarium longipes TaxID=694270 RepID=A0A395T0D4_9HYPO|nr:transcription factor [Fusarium longipes]